MKKVFAILLVSVFAFAMVACGDDDDAGGGPCDDYADMVQDDIDTVCGDFPDCSICEPVEEGEGEGEVDEDACQEAIDIYDSAAMIDTFTLLCEMEAGE
ncbi:MAG: hypothetical protein M0R80_15125 [Proteobacteria bacterium]|jgi:hypothetical protein|nr:hypothetical protein [Pseudomonadota bacterium]